MGKPFPADVFGNALRDISIPLNLSPPIVEYIIIGSANPILYKLPQIWKFLGIEMSPDGPEHVPPAIEYAPTIWECRANCIYLGVIAICHKNRWCDLRTPCLDQIQKEFNCRLRAIG